MLLALRGAAARRDQVARNAEVPGLPWPYRSFRCTIVESTWTGIHRAQRSSSVRLPVSAMRSPPNCVAPLGARRCKQHAAAMESAVIFLSTLSPCEYLPDRDSQLRYELAPHLQPAGYMQRLQQGWRRFGFAIFRPDCPSCQMCQSLRVPVATFRPSSSQRRAWKRNLREVTVRVGAPALSRDRLDLWARFHRHGHETKGWPAA